MSSESHAILSPSIEVIGHVDSSADTLARTNRPVLLESLNAIDRRGVGPGRDVDVVGAAIGVHGPFELSSTAGVVGAERLDDVVL